MINIYIIGAGGWGREVLAQLQSDIAHNNSWKVSGFLDNRSNIIDGFDCEIDIIGDPMTYTPKENDGFVCAIGEPKKRQFYAQPLLNKAANFITIHTDTRINSGVKLGRGCLLSPRVHISPNVAIGEFVNIHSQTIISHDVHIDSFAQIGAMVFIGGGVRIGSMAVIHPHATILPGIHIGDGAIVGAGSVVVKDIPEGTTVFGNPARIIYQN